MNPREKAVSSVSFSLSVWILSFCTIICLYHTITLIVLLPVTPPALYQLLTLPYIHDSPSTRILACQDTLPRTTLATPTDSSLTTDESSKI